MAFNSNNDVYWRIKDLERDNQNLQMKIRDLRQWINQANKSAVTYLLIRMKGKKQVLEIPIRCLRIVQNNTALYYEQPNHKVDKGVIIPLAKIDAWVVKGSSPTVIPASLL